MMLCSDTFLAIFTATIPAMVKELVMKRGNLNEMALYGKKNVTQTIRQI
jgi:hypothetical protein